ncbi:FMN-dependent NADH-azoreductase [Streptococcus sp. 20-1249]|uniref:FMN-dependent NADH-azoreductase n=1 Tax=Streptococcus hepaticus TaxID=3349163 RepID=UPI003749AE73
MDTLIINSHPDFNNSHSFSHRIQSLFCEKFAQAFPQSKLTVLNLYDTLIPEISKEGLLTIWQKLGAGESLTAAEDQMAEQSKALLEQFKAHKRQVFVSPMHNFNVTARAKSYIDNILIAGETFKYTEDGSVGLMSDDYRVVLLEASGSVYSDNGRYTPYEFPAMYLRAIYEEFMGFASFQIVRAEGTSILDPQHVLDKASKDLDAVFATFYQ